MPDLFSLETYNYALPPELIAVHPVSPRDAAKLLVWPQNEDKVFRDVADYMNPGDVLVLNSSKVIPARLLGVRPPRDTQSPPVSIEILLHQPVKDFTVWKAFAKPAKRLRSGDKIIIADGFVLEVVARNEDQMIVRFPCAAHEVEALLEKHGHVPLPPYIDRADDATDKTEYQTVYAKQAGSVAAPTAGLHFTDELLQKIKDKGVHVVDVTLHVGAGTFLPVTVDDIREHKMHAEWGQVSQPVAHTITAAKNGGHKVFAVGTTATRLLESAAQKTGTIQAWEGLTDIFITPGFKFRIVDGLITNFHLPKSTLLMLVSAFLGGVAPAQQLYAQAIEKHYRFYSYGDACLLTKAP